jgi:hypothetical protein
MTKPLANRDSTPAAASAPRRSRILRGLGWWLRVVEVRLRFVVLILIVLAVVTQWERLREAWDGWLYRWRGPIVGPSVSGDSEYFCPMDPGVISVWPAICPICSMDLVQRKKHDAAMLPEGVVARMQITPYRVQLAGIRTVEAERRELTYEIPVCGVLVAAGKSGDSSSSQGALEFVAAISREDAPLLTQSRSATVWPIGNRATQCEGEATPVTPIGESPQGTTACNHHVPQVRVRLIDDVLAAGTVVRGVIRVPAAALQGDATAGATTAPSDQALLAVPESAVVDHGDRQLVFVESMPGTFDAVVVEVGRRCGSYYPVFKGLRPQQKVAVAGAFLIDAETRLNPSLSRGMFQRL